MLECNLTSLHINLCMLFNKNILHAFLLSKTWQVWVQLLIIICLIIFRNLGEVSDVSIDKRRCLRSSLTIFGLYSFGSDTFDHLMIFKIRMAMVLVMIMMMSVTMIRMMMMISVMMMNSYHSHKEGSLLLKALCVTLLHCLSHQYFCPILHLFHHDIFHHHDLCQHHVH